MDYLRGFGGIGVVEGVLYQALLTAIEVLDPLLTDHDFLLGGQEEGRGGEGERGRGRGRKRTVRKEREINSFS